MGAERMSGSVSSQNDPSSSPNDSDASSADQESGEASRPPEISGLPSSQENRNDDRPESPPLPNLHYETQPGYGYPSGGIHPEPPRNRAHIWIGVIASVAAIGIVIAGVSVYLLNRSPRQWTLTAPASMAGLSRDTSSPNQSAFAGEVSTLRRGITSLPNYGSLKSTVSALYRLGPNQSVGFIGFNGTFNVQVVLKNGPHLKVSKANPGPHGGTAECGQLSPDTLCQWSTPTTVGIIVVIPTSAAANQESVAAANSLMLRIRGAVEHPSHGS
jgi:hypothetical protein